MDFNSEFKHPPVTTGDWFLTILVANIPIIGLIMLVVWAIDKQGNPSKANWAKAKLIWYAVAIGLGLLFIILMGIGAVTGMFDEFNFPDF
jgi:cytochrome bd-type quinol oxidase subunit 1